jgi:hypothetical protein
VDSSIASINPSQAVAEQREESTERKPTRRSKYVPEKPLVQVRPPEPSAETPTVNARGQVVGTLINRQV